MNPSDKLSNALAARGIKIGSRDLDRLLEANGLKLVMSQHSAVVEHIVRHNRLSTNQAENELVAEFHAAVKDLEHAAKAAGWL